MSAKILEHLMSRPIASIVSSSQEKTNVIALKLMCIVDYQLEIANMYPEITAIPTLAHQLLAFHSYASFKYLKYKLPEYFAGKKMLKCKHCELFGPYLLVLTHMNISHNFHTNGKLCMWCERMKLNSHASQNSLNQCYDKYIQSQQLCDAKYPKVFKKFYRLLHSLAKYLRVNITYTEKITNSHASVNRKQHTGHYLMDSNATVNPPEHQRQNKIDCIALNVLYGKSMTHFYGEKAQEYVSRLDHLKITISLYTRYMCINYFFYSFLLIISRYMCSDDIQTEQNTFDEVQRNSPSHEFVVEVDPAQVNIALSPSRFETPNSTTQFQSFSHTMQNSGAPKTETTHTPIAPDSFAEFITSTLKNIEDKQLRQQAMLEIQSTVTFYWAKDIGLEISENINRKY